VVSAVADLLARGTEALAISFLHAYKNPEHDDRSARSCATSPGTAGHAVVDVAPVMREYDGHRRQLPTVCPTTGRGVPGQDGGSLHERGFAAAST